MIEGPRTEEAGPNVDPSGAPVEDAGLGEDDGPGKEVEPSIDAPSAGLFDRGAIFAGWVGLGMAVVIAISFELVIAIQALVFIAAPISGILVGWYANQRSERWRPRWRLFANATYAGLVTALSLALIYVALRLLFVYADSGFRPEPQGGQLDCATGPECTFVRLVEAGFGDDLASDGITDTASFEAVLWRWQGETGLILVLATMAGALGSATVRALRQPPSAAARGRAAMGSAPAM